MNIKFKRVALTIAAVCGLALVGCSSTSHEPAELEDINQLVDSDSVWSQSVGSSVTGLVTPFLTQSGLYAAGGKRAFTCEPRAQLACDFGQDRAVWLSATFNSQALVQFNRYYYSLPIDFWTPFRDGRLQRSWQVALGGRTRVGERLTLSLEGYLKRMRNLPLIYDSDDYLLDRGGFVYGTGRVFGIEAMAQWQNERLSLTASYTYTNSRRRSEGVTYPFDYDIPHDFNTFASYDVVHQPARGRRHTSRSGGRDDLRHHAPSDDAHAQLLPHGHQL